MGDLPVLRLGSRVNAIDLLVTELRQRGYAVNGPPLYSRFGKTLESEVKRFQAQHLDVHGRPLDVDGVCGPLTWGALLRPAEDEQRTDLGMQGVGSIAGDLASGDPRIPVRKMRIIPHPQMDVYELLAACLAHYDAGVREHPMGSNRVPELEPRSQGKPWCSFWVHDRIKAVLGKWIFGGRRGSTRMDLRMAQRGGLIVTDPRPGDVFLLCDADGVPYHTGLALRMSEERRMWADGTCIQWDRECPAVMNTVEGNCANRVAIRRREITSQDVFWRPFPGELDWTPGLLPNVQRVEANREGTR